MPFNIGGPELIIILIIALIVVGPGKLPDVGAALGKSIREFRKAASDVRESASLETPQPAPRVAPPVTTVASPVPPAATVTSATAPIPPSAAVPAQDAAPAPAPEAVPAAPATPAPESERETPVS